MPRLFECKPNSIDNRHHTLSRQRTVMVRMFDGENDLLTSVEIFRGRSFIFESSRREQRPMIEVD